MAYQASVVKVMIASPGDVATERQMIRDVLFEWNSIHSEDKGLVLLPIGWDTHSSPQMGDRPQAIINKQILADCDLLVAVFWTRIGTPTGKSASGTVEEIEEHVAAGKPAMLYFSSVPVRLDSVDSEQYQQLQEFKRRCIERGLVETYDAISEFREKLTRQLAQTLNYNEYFSKYRKHESSDEELENEQPRRFVVPLLSEDAMSLLKEASLDNSGSILRIRTFGGLDIQTNGKNLVDSGNPRSEAKWEAALQQLIDNGLVQDLGYKGEIFNLTDYGYQVADSI